LKNIAVEQLEFREKPEIMVFTS